MDDKVQLSRETIVGDEVVNEDIYPNTNTASVNDDQSGTSLNETIERIWAAINNALARRVNSVNGRTGVVVLDSSDVGLENVDNISFNDIKSWVIDELNKQFGYKKIKLFANQTELEAVITANNLDDAFSPFYIEKLNETTDTRPYIGCITLDPVLNKLMYEMKPISGIGETDVSLQYERIRPESNTSGLKAGELRVKISSDEDVLYVRDNESDTYDQKGLSIDRSGMGGQLHFYDGIYGTFTNDPDHPFQDDGLISPTGQDHGVDYPTCTIKIDDKILTDEQGATKFFYLKDTTIHKNDIIVCNFDDYRIGYESTYKMLDASGIYINIDNDFANCGTGYRVGDVITVDSPITDMRFTVTAIKDGAFEGPVAGLSLLYCKRINNPTMEPLTYNTKDIVRFFQPEDQSATSDGPTTTGTITIGGSEVYQGEVSYKLRKKSYAHGLKIYIKPEHWIPAQYELPNGVDFELTMRGMCIGKVTSAPTRANPDAGYSIELNSIRPLVGNSLRFKVYDSLHKDQISKCIDIQTRKGHLNQLGSWKQTFDVSGLSIAEDWGTYRYDGESAKLIDDSLGNTLVEPGRFKRTAVLPTGVTEVMTNSQMSSGGLTIMTDMSLCIQPHELCGSYTGSNYDISNSAMADNWNASTPYIFPRYEHETPSYVGINLFKAIGTSKRRSIDTPIDIQMAPYHFYNMSGLRIVDKYVRLSKDLVGKTTDSYINTEHESGIDSYLESLPCSGGLMVNVGRGLDIRSDDPTGDRDFDVSGKVSVRTDDQSITVNDDNCLALKIKDGRGLRIRIWDPSDVSKQDASLGIDADMHSIIFDNNQLTVGVNEELYHDIDIFSNRHKVKNLIQKKSPYGDQTGLSAYVDTKYGLGFTLNSNAPHALKIKIKADDIGGPNTVYRSMYTGLTDDILLFDKDGVLRAPIDTTKGLKNTYIAKANSSDSKGNVEVVDKGGIAINAGPGLTFTEDGALTLSEGYDLRPLSSGFDLNNLTVGSYCTESDEIGNSIVNRPIVSTNVGAFRVEHVKMYEGHYMQRLYPYNSPDKFYMRYCGTVDPKWSNWYMFSGTMVQ